MYGMRTIQIKEAHTTTDLEKIMKATAKFAHNANDIPGEIIFDGEEEEIKAQARKFVKDGMRDGTWVNVDFGDHAYAVRNVMGKAVARNTAY